MEKEGGNGGEEGEGGMLRGALGGKRGWRCLLKERKGYNHRKRWMSESGIRHREMNFLF